MISIMTLLALDPSMKNFGYAILSDGQRIVSGAQSFAKLTDCADLAIAVEQWLTELIEQYHVTDMAVEMPHMRGSSTYILFGLVWTAHRVAKKMGVRRREIRASELKKFATGSGGADKDQMMAAAEAKYGYSPTSHDEADALLIGAWAAGTGIGGARKAVTRRT